MCKCIINSFIFLISLISIGLCLGISVYLFITIKEKDIHSVSETSEKVLIAIIVISGSILLFSIYASFCGGICVRKILGIIYILFALCLIATAICGWVFKNKILDFIESSWEKGDKYDPEVIVEIEKAFNCCGYKTSYGCPSNSTQCSKLVDDNINEMINTGNLVFLIVALFLIICAVILYIKRWDKPKIESNDVFP